VESSPKKKFDSHLQFNHTIGALKMERKTAKPPCPNWKTNKTFIHCQAGVVVCSNEESEGVVGRRRIFVRGYGKSEPKKGTRGR